MLDLETWQIINASASWASAIGTIAAVITALYLARKDARIYLSINAGVRVLLAENQGSGLRAEYLMVDVTNLGRRVATVSQIYWRTGIFRRRDAVWITPRNLLSSTIPVKLADGECATFIMPISELKTNFDPLADILSGRAGGFKARFIRVGVSTSTGERFERKIEKGLQRFSRE